MLMDKRVEMIPLKNINQEIPSGSISKEYNCFLVGSPDRIFEIEKLRKGGDVRLAILLEVQFHYRGRSPDLRQLYSNVPNMNMTIPQSQWVKYLEEMGYGERRIFEVPNPIILKDQPLDSGIKLMEEAHSLLKKGQHEVAFSKCRLALDEIYVTFNSGTAATPVKFDNDIKKTIDEGSKPASKPKSGKHPNKSVYIDSLRREIREYSHLAHHGTYKITPEDAEFLVYLCWDLVSYLSKQLAIANKQWPKP